MSPVVATPDRPWLLSLLGAICGAFAAWSFLGSSDRGVWAFEVVPTGLILLSFFLTATAFRFTDLVYVLLAWFFVIQCFGGRYTFAEVPGLDWLGEWLGRNPADRIGHFFQGFVPAMVIRELMLRRSPLRAGTLTFVLVAACCLAFSAAYELLEMWVVLLFYPDAGPEWLGMQGDPWDAQWDMSMALLGSILAQVLLGRVHDLAMRRMSGW